MFEEIVKQRLEEMGASAIKLALDNGLPRDAIRSVLRGHPPSVERARDIASAIGLEFYIGAPRESGSLNQFAINSEFVAVLGLPDDAGEGEILEKIKELLSRVRSDDDRWNAVQQELSAIRSVIERPIVSDQKDTEDEIDQISESPALYSAPVRYNELADLADDAALSAERLPARQVDVMELAAAAGGGATELDETVTGQVWFARHWLDQRGLDAAQCSVIVVKGESMEPTLPDSCSILVARQRKRRKDGKLFVLLTADGLVVKRLSKAPNESWQLQSDHPAWPPVAWSAEVTIIGQVVWMARRL